MQTPHLTQVELLEARSPPVPRAHGATPTRELPERAQLPALGREAQAPGSALGLPEGGDTPGQPPRNRSPASARRKEAAAEEGATGASRARLTCAGHGPGPHLPRGGPRGREPSRLPAAVAAGRPPGSGAQGPRGAPALAPRASLSPVPARVPGLEPEPHPPTARTHSPRGRRWREGGREGGAPPASGGLERAWPRSRPRRGDSVQRAAPRGLGCSARRAGGGGCWRAAPASARAPGRAPAAPLAAPPPRPPRWREVRGPRTAHAGPDPASRSAGAPNCPAPAPRLWALTAGVALQPGFGGHGAGEQPPGALTLRPRSLAGTGADHAAPELPHR